MIHKSISYQTAHIHYYISEKKKAEAIVFLHAAYADHHCFDNQIACFSDKYTIITLDLLGHGMSQLSDGKTTINTTAHQICKILELEGFTKAHIIGVSLGALLAQHFALEYPQKTSSVISLGGYDISADNKEINKAQRKVILSSVLKAIFSMPQFRKFVAKQGALLPENQEKCYQMAQSFKRKSFMGMSGLDNVIKKREHIPHAHSLLILCGEGDIELSRSAALRWHQSDPQSKYSLIPQAGHCANMDNPNFFNKIVYEFFEHSKNVTND